MAKSKIRPPTSDTNVPPRAADILRNLDCETVELNGVQMTMLEAGIRLLYARSLKGDIRASFDLQRMRDRCSADTEPRPAGCLVVPEKIPDDEWERLAYEQQRPFRESDYGKGPP